MSASQAIVIAAQVQKESLVNSLENGQVKSAHASPFFALLMTVMVTVLSHLQEIKLHWAPSNRGMLFFIFKGGHLLKRLFKEALMCTMGASNHKGATVCEFTLTS